MAAVAPGGERGPLGGSAMKYPLGSQRRHPPPRRAPEAWRPPTRHSNCILGAPGTPVPTQLFISVCFPQPDECGAEVREFLLMYV